MTDSLGTARVTLTVDTNDFEVAISRAKNSVSGMSAAAQAEYQKLSRAEKQRVDSLQRQVDKLGLTREEQLAYNAVLRTEGQLQSELLSKIKANTKAVTDQGGAVAATTKQFNQYGLSAKQQVAAMRGVPAQLTDIFVSLQGGQNPLTVLLQQGGQLKDMFGGLVPAAKALGSALLGLVNPYTVTAAGIGVVLAAAIGGEQRMNKFAQALILTGQAGAVSASDLQNAAEALDQISGNTSREAADALTQIAANGLIAAENYGLVAEAALAMERATGQAFDKTIQAYADLARDPVNAILKLNESENFLTQSVYDRIKALQDAGDIEGAATVATNAYAANQIARASEVEESLGLITGAWHGIKNATGEAWDEAVNYFANLDRDAKAAVGTLARLKNAFTLPGGASPFAAMAAAYGPGTATGAGSTTADPVVNSKAVKELAAITQQNLSREEAQRKEIVRIQNLGVAAGLKQAEIDKLIADSKKKYADSLPKGSKGAQASIDNAASRAALQAIKDQLAEEQAALRNSRSVLQAEYAAKLVTTEDYYKRTRDLIAQDTAAQEKAVQAQIDSLRSRTTTGKDSINVTREIGQLEAQLTKIRLDAAAADKVLTIQQDALSAARERSIQGYIDALDLENKALRDSVNANIAAIGMGQRRAKQLGDLAKLLAEQAEQERKLANTLAEDKDTGKYDRELQALRERFAERIKITKEGFAQEAAAQADWLNGVRAGVENWADATANVAAQTADLIESTLGKTADLIAETAITGKLQWREFLIDLGEQIVKFMAKQAVLNFLKAFAQSDTGQAAASGDGFWAQAITAVVGAFTKSSAAPAQHGAQMRLAGPTTTIPSQSTGPKSAPAMANAQMATPTLNIITNVANDGTSSTQVTGDKTAYDTFAKNMANVAQQEINKAMRPGGSIWRARGATA